MTCSYYFRHMISQLNFSDRLVKKESFVQSRWDFQVGRSSNESAMILVISPGLMVSLNYHLTEVK